MKQKTKKPKKTSKGMPQAVLLSILIHVALFLLAGTLVVFTVVKKQEKKFEPPKAVERPKMKLKKPKVKIKKSSRPKPTTRIVTKMNRASMPDIQLPEMSGVGEGLGGGIGGFDIMPDFSEESLFGAAQSIGNDFEGTFYDMKRRRNGSSLGTTDPDKLINDVKKFVSSGWSTSIFARYYHSPKKLYATHFTTGVVPSVLGPMVFGEQTGGWLWLVHYKGQLVHKESITFRFWGSGDDIMLVRVNGKMVLNACKENVIENYASRITPHWQTPEKSKYQKYWLGSVPSVVGDWITLEPGVPLDMEVLIGETRGDFFTAALLVEVKGEEYERIGHLLAPALPIFTTTDLTRDVIEAVRGNLVPGEAGITNKVVVFRDYDVSDAAAKEDLAVTEPTVPEGPPVAKAVEEKTRIWTGQDGKVLEAELITVIGNKAVLKDAHGKQRKIPLTQLSEEDRLFIELANPPKFNIDFSKKSSTRSIDGGPFAADLRWVPRIYDYIFSARLKQTSVGEYNHELHVELIVFGEEINGNNYILLDRQESTFTPTKENGRSHEFHGGKVMLEVRDWTFFADLYKGEKYGGYLIVVTDQRGEIIDVGTSHKWLPGIADKLRDFPLGKHFDKTGTRTYPPSYNYWY
ncbi:MAG: hypothetical protein DRP64_12085 [Verrucomicrobia bacterium]|nr:MAG: hypothetical protein DRP64_12085 [Verrucomicrobiota bacterium]